MIETVLYVGQPDTERAAHFRSFLSDHFVAVRFDSVDRVGQLDLRDVDVVIIDGDPHSQPSPPEELIPENLPLPTVLIGGVGGKVSDAIGLKLGWEHGCLCLDHRAIVEDASLEHPVFKGPVQVPAPTIDTIPTPETFLHYTATKNVPEKVPVAAMHAGPPERTEAEKAELAAKAQALFEAGDYDGYRALSANEPTPGLVSTSAGFLDSPDCERILGGVNMKAHDYVAVGRQGRFLAWGFHGDPSSMTELGKALFLNSIHYISQYAEAPVEALRVLRSREVLHTMLGFLDSVPAEQASQMLVREFGDAVPGGIGGSVDEALAWWAVNRGFLRYTGTRHRGHYEVDGDLVAVGIANDDPALLDAVAPHLGLEGEAGERARRLWERYVRRDPSDVDREQAWLAEHRDALFFSDWAGYRWIARDDLPVLAVPRSGFQEEGPVAVGASASRTAGELTVDVQFFLQPGYYLYAPGASDGIPVSLDPASPHELIGPPVFPESEDFHLTGRPLIRLRLRGESDEVEVDVTVQACNEQSCTPPSTVRVRAVAAS